MGACNSGKMRLSAGQRPGNRDEDGETTPWGRWKPWRGISRLLFHPCTLGKPGDKHLWLLAETGESFFSNSR